MDVVSLGQGTISYLGRGAILLAFTILHASILKLPFVVCFLINSTGQRWGYQRTPLDMAAHHAVPVYGCILPPLPLMDPSWIHTCTPPAPAGFMIILPQLLTVALVSAQITFLCHPRCHLLCYAWSRPHPARLLNIPHTTYHISHPARLLNISHTTYHISHQARLLNSLPTKSSLPLLLPPLLLPCYWPRSSPCSL